ncbi:tripartite tricarboxylate transporter substrate binding protein [Ramlibacter sp. 2FC]|uniref:Bug family tripartite tricarboxylate transporter substrate binding protein n=1 Tax=Ramlibacter sp. 2FC TaxID=2502188 RepID=UPI00201DA41E|nr:tripartite tricarboxylate transporter substrate binding protein [Ramlibacter sp. 2FC]
MSGLLASAALSLLSPSAMAQEWPSKPVRIVVGGPAGGTADALARLLAEGLGPALGKPVIVEAKPGAAGAIAVNDLLSSPHDGHTLLLIQGGIVSETPLAIKTAYEPFKDLKPLAQVTRQGLVLVGNTSFPAKNLRELIAHVKANPGKVSYASYAAGMRGHTTGLQFNKLAGLDMTHVGYKGSPPALQDVMGGHVPLMVDGTATSLPLIKAGKIKAYAVNFPTRISDLPDVPTFAELGFPEISEVGWMGLWSTPDLPAAVQARIRQATLQQLQQPKVQERIKAMGMEVGQALSSEELARDLRGAHARQGELLRSINFKPE